MSAGVDAAATGGGFLAGLPLLGIGAGLGLLKTLAFDGPRERRQRKLAAETERLSPWTGLKPGSIQEADPLGTSIGFGLTGYQLGQGSKISELNQKLLQKAIDAPNNPVAQVSAGGGMPMNFGGGGGGGGSNPWSLFGPGGSPGGGNYNLMGGGFPAY
jgi:hypothetical protein